MTMYQEDSARSNARTAAYICLLFAAVIISIDAFFVIQTYTSIEADGSRKYASLAQGFVIVLIAPILFGISGFFPEYKKLFNALSFAGIIASIAMMALSQSSSDITAGKVAAKSEKIQGLIETQLKNNQKKNEQMQVAADNLNKSKEAWHHVLATRTINASSAPANKNEELIKDLKSEKEGTPLIAIVGEGWMIAIRVIIAVLMNLVHAALMHAAGDLLRKSFGTVPIGQQILDAIHKMGASGHGPSAAPATQQQVQDQPAPQPVNNGLITVSLTKIEPATASNDASAVNPAPAPAPVTAPAAEAAPVADKGLKMPRWFTTIFKTSAAATAPLAGAAQFPPPAPVQVPEITPPSISVQDTQNRAAITLVDTLKSVREEQPKEPVKAPVPLELELVSIEAQNVPVNTLKSVRSELPKEPEKEPLELVSIEAQNVPVNTLKSVRSEKPARAELAACVQVDTGVKYPFNFRYLRIKKLVKKGLKPSVESIKISDVPCGQEVATRYQSALVDDGVIERKGRGYVLTQKYQKMLGAKAAKKKAGK